jgi:hypothetical protein
LETDFKFNEIAVNKINCNNTPNEKIGSSKNNISCYKKIINPCKSKKEQEQEQQKSMEKHAITSHPINCENNENNLIQDEKRTTIINQNNGKNKNYDEKLQIKIENNNVHEQFCTVLKEKKEQQQNGKSLTIINKGCACNENDTIIEQQQHIHKVCFRTNPMSLFSPLLFSSCWGKKKENSDTKSSYQFNCGQHRHHQHCRRHNDSYLHRTAKNINSNKNGNRKNKYRNMSNSLILCNNLQPKTTVISFGDGDKMELNDKRMINKTVAQQRSFDTIGRHKPLDRTTWFFMSEHFLPTKGTQNKRRI